MSFLVHLIVSTDDVLKIMAHELSELISVVLLLTWMFYLVAEIFVSNLLFYAGMWDTKKVVSSQKRYGDALTVLFCLTK